MEKIFFRLLNPADYQEYQGIWLNCLKQHPDNFGSTYEEAIQGESYKLTNAIQAADEYDFAFGAFTSDRVLIGICGFITEMRVKARHRGELVQLFVDAAFKGRGVGYKLVQLTVKKAFANGQTEQVILSVAAVNEGAIRLYKQVGFKEYGRLGNYFKSGDVYFTQSFFCLMKDSYLLRE